MGSSRWWWCDHKVKERVMKRFLLYIGIAIAVIGCAKDGEFTMTSGDVLTISSDIATRAEKSSWVATDAIGVDITSATSTTHGDVESNVKFTTSSKNLGIFTSDPLIYYPYDTKVNILAIYPYKDVSASAYPIISSEQVDLLSAREYSLSSSSGAVDLTFYHKLSKLSITVKAGDGITLADLSGVTATISNMTTEATFDLTSSQVADTTVTDGSLTLTTTEDSSTSTIMVSGIVIPQEFSSSTLTFTTSDSRVFKVDFPIIEFEVGYEYSYTAKVGYEEVTITKSSITAWDDATYNDQEAYIVDIELKDDIYYINSAKGLVAFSDLVNSYTVNGNSSGAVIAGFDESAFGSSVNNLKINGKLTRDIDLQSVCYENGPNWKTIGYYNAALASDATTGKNRYYEGTFDGCGYKITNLYISTTGNMQSLFRGLYTDGVVCNLGVEGSITNKSGETQESGGIVSHNYGSIINCYSEVKVDTDITNAGGITAYNTASGKVVNCYNLGIVNGKTNVGGIVGYNDDGFVGHCYNSGAISASGDNDTKVGGVVGWNAITTQGDDPNVKGCFCEDTATYSIGQVEYSASVGLVGNVCSKEYLQSESFVTTINNSCAAYDYASMTLAVDPCGFKAVSGDYASINFGGTLTYTDVDISYNSLSYNINTAKGLEAFAALVNGTAMPTGVITSGNTASGDDIYFQFNNSEYSYSDIDGNLKANVSLDDICNSNNGGTNWAPIGTDSKPYKGVFNGGGFLVSDLYIYALSSSYRGLFGCVKGATIYDLGVGGEVTGFGIVGGLVGENCGGTIINCYNTCSVSSNGETGGLVGSNKTYLDDNSTTIYGKVINCYNRGTVSGTGSIGGSIGGMVGYNASGCSIICGYSTGSVSNGLYVGGVVGKNDSASDNVTGCYCIEGINSIGTGTGAGIANAISDEKMKGNSYVTGSSYLVDVLNTSAASYNSSNSDATYKACTWVAETSSYPTLDF